MLKTGSSTPRIVDADSVGAPLAAPLTGRASLGPTNLTPPNQRSLKVGFRFSRNARIPSCASSVSYA
jgi:hypothetical protein